MKPKKSNAIIFFVIYHLIWLYAPIFIINQMFQLGIEADTFTSAVIVSAIAFLGFAVRRYNQQTKPTAKTQSY